MTLQTTVAVPTEADLEFDRQVHSLALTGLPALLEVKDECFRAMLEPLRDVLPPADPAGTIPFVVVVPEAPVETLLASAHAEGGEGFTTMATEDLAGFRPLPELAVPAGPYLLLDVDTGPDTLGVAPAEALPRISGAGRSPLTLAEGLALLVTEPGVLRTRNAFSLLGSRAGDKRVPALWLSSGRPRLGWRWQGAPHNWLGAASCGGRRAG
jgi:uncharacterized protein DUF5701